MIKILLLKIIILQLIINHEAYSKKIRVEINSNWCVKDHLYYALEEMYNDDQQSYWEAIYDNSKLAKIRNRYRNI